MFLTLKEKIYFFIRCRAGNQVTCIFLEQNTQPITEPETTTSSVTSTNSATDTATNSESTIEITTEAVTFTTTEPTTVTDEDVNPCLGVMNGLKPHDDDCTKYIRCSNER